MLHQRLNSSCSISGGVSQCKMWRYNPMWAQAQFSGDRYEKHYCKEETSSSENVENMEGERYRNERMKGRWDSGPEEGWWVRYKECALQATEEICGASNDNERHGEAWCTSRISLVSTDVRYCGRCFIRIGKVIYVFMEPVKSRWLSFDGWNDATGGEGFTNWKIALIWVQGPQCQHGKDKGDGSKWWGNKVMRNSIICMACRKWVRVRCAE